jgi:hypothetical protein
MVRCYPHFVSMVKGIRGFACIHRPPSVRWRIVSVLLPTHNLLISIIHLFHPLIHFIMYVNMKSLLLLGFVTFTVAAPTPGGGLEARMAKKKIPDSVTCKGTVLEKSDIGSALSQAKTKACLDKTTGKYPHKFTNQSGRNTVFGATSDLCEYPILKGGTYTSKFSHRELGRVNDDLDSTDSLEFTTAGEPGIYRVIYKKSDQSYVGVTVKKDAGGTVEACTANAAVTEPATSSAEPTTGPATPTTKPTTKPVTHATKPTTPAIKPATKPAHGK